MHLQDARLEKIRRMHSRARGSTNIRNKRNRERDLINNDMEIKGYNHPGKKHSVVAVNPDGSVAGIFDFIQDATKKYGIDRQ